jgi:hypothetical protein
MRKTKLPSGEEVPVLGQGTWGFGEPSRKPPERNRRAAVRYRHRHEADRHGRNVWRRRGRGIDWQGDRRAQGTDLHRRQGPSTECDAQRNSRGLRAKRAPPRDRPYSASCAWKGLRSAARWRVAGGPLEPALKQSYAKALRFIPGDGSLNGRFRSLVLDRIALHFLDGQRWLFLGSRTMFEFDFSLRHGSRCRIVS